MWGTRMCQPAEQVHWQDQNLHSTAWQHHHHCFMLLLFVGDAWDRMLGWWGDGWSKYQNTLRAEAMISGMGCTLVSSTPFASVYVPIKNRRMNSVKRKKCFNQHKNWLYLSWERELGYSNRKRSSCTCSRWPGWSGSSFPVWKPHIFCYVYGNSLIYSTSL